MRLLILSLSSLIPLSFGACKWTEFDDLRDEAWVHSVEKPDGSKSNSWGVAIVRGKSSVTEGGRLAVFGSAQSRLNEIQYDNQGGARQLDEQNLGNIGIGNLSIEPLVLGDPATDDFALITQGSAMQVVVAAGGDSNLTQFIINGATSVDAAAYMRAPTIDSAAARDGRTAQPSQPIIASGNTLFGTFFINPDGGPAFNQVKCAIVDGATPVTIRGLMAVPNPNNDGDANDTDDLAVWTANGSMLLIDGHVFNGARSGTAGSGTFVCPNELLDISSPSNRLADPADVAFTPDPGTVAQMIPIDDRFALIQGHTNSTSLLGVWDFEATAGQTPVTAGGLVGSKVEEGGLRSIDLFRDGSNLHVVAGYPNALVDGVEAGQVKVYPVSTDGGVNPTQTEVFTDSQTDDGQVFGRAVAVYPYNGQPVIAVAANNEVFTFFRTPTLYNTDRREGR